MSAADDTTRFIVLGARPAPMQHDPTHLHLLVNRVPRYEELRWRQHGPFYPGAITAETLADIHRQFPELAQQQRQAIAERAARRERDKAERQRHIAERARRWSELPADPSRERIRDSITECIEREFGPGGER